MNTTDLKKKYIEFFKNKKHSVLESAPLIPDNDPTVLFTTAGMHPLVPFLLGQEHPLGKRLTSNQMCIRTTDIDSVGDKTHLTFFEMLGNWSLGDYFKKDAIDFAYEFLTNPSTGLGLPKEKLAITCFSGKKNVPKDTEAYNYWLEKNIPIERISFIEDNWWGPIGATGPCGPDTEIFYWSSEEKPPVSFDPTDERWVEIWNLVFMQYNKKKEGDLIELKQKNIDTGLGLERVVAILNNKDDVFKIKELNDMLLFVANDCSNKNCLQENLKAHKIIVDHLRASVFILGDDKAVTCSNVDQGYVLRRLIRRAIRYGNQLNLKDDFVCDVAKKIISIYSKDYSFLERNKDFILQELKKEENKFKQTITKGLSVFNKFLEYRQEISGKDAFLLYQSYGFPIEMIIEIAKENKKMVDVDGFYKEYEDHKKLSRQGATKRFKGGLSGHSTATTRLHTATHILNQVLRDNISYDIKQKGSNITPARLRFDFNFDRKLTDQELANVQKKVNEVIQKDLVITKEKMSLKDAIESGAQSEFGARYPDYVWVYSIENFSREICAGPHADRTSELGFFKIIKEESVAAGVRRIKAILE